MTLQNIKDMCTEYARDVMECLEAQWRFLNTGEKNSLPNFQKNSIDQKTTLSEGFTQDFACAMKKFMSDEGAILGSFGTRDYFYDGLEARLGMADPQIFRAIVLENVDSQDSHDAILTKNYGIFTTPKIEFTRVLGISDFQLKSEGKNQNKECDLYGQQFLFEVARGEHLCKGPKMTDLIALGKQFESLKHTYQTLVTRKLDAKSIVGLMGQMSDSRELATFPGDIGDTFIELMADFLWGVGPLFATFSDKFFIDLSKRSFEKNEYCLRGVQKMSSESSKYSVCLHFYCDEMQSQIILEKIREDLQNVIEAQARDKLLDDIEQQKDLNTVIDCKSQLIGTSGDVIVKVVGLQRCVYCENIHLTNKPTIQLVNLFPAEINEKTEIIESKCHDAYPRLKSILKQGRRTVSIAELMMTSKVIEAGLRLEEAIVVYQYTGPLFQIWNHVLRTMPKRQDLPGNLYTTTIHTLVSAVIKLSRITAVPHNRLVYRGLGGMVLNEMWSSGDKEMGVRGGVEYGFLSTTLNKKIALEYSGVESGNGIVFEINVGAIDNGAQLDSISQYPGENELLFSPLSHLEVIDNPRIEYFEGRQVYLIPLDININLKCQTIEEMIGKRKHLILALVKNVKKELEFELRLVTGKDQRDSKSWEQDFEFINKQLQNHDAEWYNSDHNFSLELQSILEWKRATFLAELQIYVAQVHKRDLNKALINMTQRGNTQVVIMLLKLGADAFSEDDNGKTALDMACKKGHAKIAESLIQNLLWVKKAHIWTPRFRIVAFMLGVLPVVAIVVCVQLSKFILVVVFGVFECFSLSFLLRRYFDEPKTISVGKDLNAGDEFQKTPLHLASELGHFFIVCKLLAAGANQISQDKYGRTPLHYAVEQGHTAIISKIMQKEKKTLRDQGLVGFVLFTVGSLLMFGCVYLYLTTSRISNGVLYLGAAGLCLGLSGTGVLLVVVRNGFLRFSMLRSLIIAKDNQERTPMELVSADDLPLQFVVKALLVPSVFAVGTTRGASLNGQVNNTNAAGKTALHLASECGFKAMVSLLLEAKATVNHCDQAGRTPLHNACFNSVQAYHEKVCLEKSLDVIKCLVKAGAVKNILDSTGNSPLGWASLCLSRSEFGNEKVIFETLKVFLNSCEGPTSHKIPSRRRPSRVHAMPGNNSTATNAIFFMP